MKSIRLNQLPDGPGKQPKSQSWMMSRIVSVILVYMQVCDSPNKSVTPQKKAFSALSVRSQAAP